MPPLTFVSGESNMKPMFGGLEKRLNCVKNSGSKHLKPGTRKIVHTTLQLFFNESECT